MDFQKDGLIYILMVIPLFFTGTVFVSGIQKLHKNPTEGKVAMGLGVVLLGGIAAAYFLFIK